MAKGSRNKTLGWGGGVRLALALGLLYALYLVITAGLAHWYARHPTPERLRQAIRFDPGNPRYYAALARLLQYSLDAANPEEAIGLYEKATHLRPHQARYWAELASAYEDAGRLADAEQAYERAQRLFPNSPDIQWRRANFSLRVGKVHEAFSRFQPLLLNNPALRRPTFDLAWRAAGDADLILAEMIPADAEVLLLYVSYLVETQRMDAAVGAWERLLSLRLDFEPAAAFPYLDALIQHGRLQELARAWATLAERFPTRWPRPPDPSNRITNGDFESETLKGGPDWRLGLAEGVSASLDEGTALNGRRSLKIHFDGRHNLDYGHLFQYVLVEPNTAYRFQAHLRLQDITTDSGPRFQVYDAYEPAKLSLSTENLVGSTSWVTQELAFKTGTGTRLLVVRLARPPSRKFDNKIAGTVWIDGVSLTAVKQGSALWPSARARLFRLPAARPAANSPG